MQRLNDIDIAKGIGILMVMGLHCGFHQTWMATYEMPLFFILSGCFFNPYSCGFKLFVIKKINTLLIPYIFFEAPKLLYDLWFWLCHENKTLLECYIDSSLPTTTWFILCLFEIQILCYFIIKLLKSKFLILLAGFALSIIGYELWQFRVYNCFFLCTAATCSFYFILGYVCKDILKHNKQKARIVSGLIGIFSLAGCYLLWTIHRPDIFYRGNMMTDNWIIIVLMALFGSGGIILISKAIAKNKVLEFFGINSLIILGTHLYFFLIFRVLDIHLLPIIIFAFGVIIEIPIIYILRRHFPRFCGIEPLIKYTHSYSQ